MEENTLKLFHYDDGKGKYQSHEVFIGEYDSCYCTLIGYGETKKEAIIDFKNKYDEFLFASVRK